VKEKESPGSGERSRKAEEKLSLCSIYGTNRPFKNRSRWLGIGDFFCYVVLDGHL